MRGTLASWLLNAYLDLVYDVLITLGQVKLTSIITGRTYNLSVDILYQVWYRQEVSLEEMLVPRRKSPSHALLKELLFSGEMKHLEN